MNNEVKHNKMLRKKENMKGGQKNRSSATRFLFGNVERSDSTHHHRHCQKPEFQHPLFDCKSCCSQMQNKSIVRCACILGIFGDDLELFACSLSGLKKPGKNQKSSPNTLVARLKSETKSPEKPTEGHKVVCKTSQTSKNDPKTTLPSLQLFLFPFAPQAPLRSFGRSRRVYPAASLGRPGRRTPPDTPVPSPRSTRDRCGDFWGRRFCFFPFLRLKKGDLSTGCCSFFFEG